MLAARIRSAARSALTSARALPRRVLGAERTAAVGSALGGARAAAVRWAGAVRDRAAAAPVGPRTRRTLRYAPAALGGALVLAVPGAAAVGAGPSDPAAQAAAVDAPGLRTVATAVESGGVTVDTAHFVLPGADAFAGEVRTLMAEAQTAFLEEHSGEDGASLTQAAEPVAVSEEVQGARIERTVEADGAEDGPQAETHWWNGGERLPWTALFAGGSALAELDGEVARLAAEQTGQVPEGLAGDGSAEPLAGGGAPAQSGPDAEEAGALAEEYSGSPLAGAAFDTEGGLLVTAGGEQIAVPAEQALPLLSPFGVQARDAAVDGEPPADEGPGAAPLDCSRAKCVALTFDDGPGEHTGRLLEELDAYGAQATFYVLGQLVDAEPEMARRIVEEGHEIGSHSWKHDDLGKMSGGAVADDLDRTAAEIEDATGVHPPTMRPPYGSYTDATLAAADMPVVLWDVDTMDWQSRDSGKVADEAVSLSQPGSVVLMHDIHASTVDAVPDILARLHAEGYHFTTVTDLFAGTGFADAEAHERRP